MKKAQKSVCFQLREAMSLFVSKTGVQGCYEFCTWLLSSTPSTRLAVLKLDRATPAANALAFADHCKVVIARLLNQVN